MTTNPTMTESYDDRLARERAERAAESERVFKLCATTAALLGGGWAAESKGDEWGYGHALITGPDGIVLHVSTSAYGHHRGRLSIGSIYPQSEAYRPESVNITLAGSSTSARVASEIRRRVLPTVGAELVKLRAAIATHDSETDSRDDILLELVAYHNGKLGTRPEARVSGKRTAHAYVDGAQTCAQVEWCAYSGDYVSLEVSYLTPDQARRLAAALREIAPPSDDR